MDKCREEFEKYIRDQSGFTADFQIGCNGQYKSDLMHFMFITWQHQQAKVEELQKRVDAAISNIEKFFDEQTQQPTQREYANFIADVLHDLKLEQALKGEADV